MSPSNLPLPRLIGLLLLLFASSVIAQQRVYRIDPEHSRIQFRVEHLGLSHTLGSFSGLDGEFRFDPEHWDRATVSVDIPLDSLDLGSARWQKKVLDDYLQADRHAIAHFEATMLTLSSASTSDDEVHGTLDGRLQLNGISRDIRLQVRYNGSKRNVYTKLKRKAGFSASTTIQRSEFGLDKQLDVVGDTIELRIEIEGIAQRQR